MSNARGCAQCGSPFDHKGTRAVYCSVTCRAAYRAAARRKRPTVVCVQCGTEFPNRVGGPSICSPGCRAIRDRAIKRSFQPSIRCSDCPKLIDSRGSHGRCSTCQQRVKRAEFIAEENPCEVEGCAKLRRMPGVLYCDMHRSRLRRFGAVGAVEPAYVRGAGSIDENGYRIVTVEDGRRGPEHRFVMEKRVGRRLYPDETVHHKNGVRHDNRIANLELWSSWHPAGQRVEDKLRWAHELIARYERGSA